MERHTYFLPRYSDTGKQLAQGHVLAAAAAVPCLYRRTNKYSELPAPEGEYDFVNYFECADRDVNRFHEVCAALRDTAQNVENVTKRSGPSGYFSSSVCHPGLVQAPPCRTKIGGLCGGIDAESFARGLQARCRSNAGKHPHPGQRH